MSGIVHFLAATESNGTMWRRSIIKNSTQRSERCPEIFGEQHRLFPGGEVTALVDLVVVNQIGVRLFYPTTRRLVELVRECRHGDWNLDTLGIHTIKGGRTGYVSGPPSEVKGAVISP